MSKKDNSIVYLDTHIVLWLYEGLTEKFTDQTKEELEQSDIYISQFVKLELQKLYEQEHILIKPKKIIDTLKKEIDLRESNVPLNELVEEAAKIEWTDDFFDRFLVAEAKLKKTELITADEYIIENF